MSSNTILVIDDSAQQVHLVRSTLEGAPVLRNLGLRVLEAGDGRGGLKLYRQHRPQLIITDLLMPCMTGFELLDALWNEEGVAPPPVIVTTGLYQEDGVLEELQTKFSVTLLRKPVSTRRLVGIVARLLRPSTDEQAKEPPAPRRESPAPKERAAKKAGRARPGAARHGQRRAHRRSRTVQRVGEPRPLAQGSLSERPLAAVLMDVLEARVTGYLDLRRDQVRKRVHLREGVPAFVESGVRAETLGQILVNVGRIDKEQHFRTVRHMTDSGGMYGEALVHLGLMEEDEVLEFLAQQVRRKIEHCLCWSTGTWTYGEADLQGCAQRHIVDPVKMLLEYLPRYMNLEQALAELGADAEHHRLELQPRWRRLRDHFVDVFSGARIRAIEEGRTLAELLQMGGLYETVEQLHLLMQCDMARRARVERPAAIEAPSPDPLDLGRLARRATSVEVPALPADDSPALVTNDGADDTGFRRLVRETFLGLEGCDHYGLLGIPHDADTVTIQGAYVDRKAAYKPSRIARRGPEQGYLVDINRALDEAHLVLCDSTSRRQYDDELSLADQETREWLVLDEQNEVVATEAWSRFNAGGGSSDEARGELACHLQRGVQGGPAARHRRGAARRRAAGRPADPAAGGPVHRARPVPARV